MKSVRARQGITLLEVLIASAMAAVLALAVAETWFASEEVYRTGTSLSQAQSSARTAMQRLEREVRSGSRASLDSAVLPSELKFQTLPPDATTPVQVRYYRDADGNLIREEGGTTSVVTRNVTAFEIVSASAEAITLRIDVEVGDLDASLETKVGFRNP